MAGLLELYEKPLTEMEAEIDQQLPVGKYVLKLTRVTNKIKPLRDDPEKNGMEVYLNFVAIRPLDKQDPTFNPSKYESILNTFRENQSSQFVRFVKTAGFQDGMNMDHFMKSQYGRLFVADVSYSIPNQEGQKPFTNLRGLMPMDVYEARLAKVVKPVVASTGGGDDELE